MTPTLDVEALRRDTPGCAHRNHLNNAGAGLMPSPVLDAVREHLELESRIGGYEAADEAGAAVADAYASVARLVGAAPRNVAFVENATVATSQALSAVPFERGDVIVTTRNDYVSNQIMYLSLRERFGVEVVRAPDLAEGGVDPDALERAVRDRRPRLVAVTHVPTNSGLVQPVAEVGRICREHDVLFLLDACQSVGQMPLDVTELGCDFLAATARKFLRGPRGVGFLYASDQVLEAGLMPLFPDLRGADWVEGDRYRPARGAARFENWEFAYGLILGLGRAAGYALELGIEAIRKRAWTLAAELRAELESVEGVRVLDRGGELCAIATVAVAGWSPEGLMHELRDRGINTAASYRSYAVIDFDDKGVEGALRISPHCYNTERETRDLLHALKELTT